MDSSFTYQLGPIDPWPVFWTGLAFAALTALALLNSTVMGT